MYLSFGLFGFFFVGTTNTALAITVPHKQGVNYLYQHLGNTAFLKNLNLLIVGELCGYSAFPCSDFRKAEHVTC